VRGRLLKFHPHCDGMGECYGIGPELSMRGDVNQGDLETRWVLLASPEWLRSLARSSRHFTTSDVQPV
jgi:hypothetical protein